MAISFSRRSLSATMGLHPASAGLRVNLSDGGQHNFRLLQRSMLSRLVLVVMLGNFRRG
jgi:hypothetical protein